MSANRDRSQKFRFLYQNLYQIYRDGVDEAKKSPVAHFTPKAHEAYRKAGLTSGVVLKAQEPAPVDSVVSAKNSEIPPFIPRKLIQDIAALPEAAVPTESFEEPISEAKPISIGLRAREERRKTQLEALREQLSELSVMQKKIRFMLREIEELSKPESKS